MVTMIAYQALGLAALPAIEPDRAANDDGAAPTHARAKRGTPGPSAREASERRGTPGGRAARRGDGVVAAELGRRRRGGGEGRRRAHPDRRRGGPALGGSRCRAAAPPLPRDREGRVPPGPEGALHPSQIARNTADPA